MTEKRRHPGHTGIPEWIDWELKEPDRNSLAQWLRDWKLERVDEAAFLEAVETSVRLYVQLKLLAQKSSAGSVRKNLEAAARASDKLLAQVDKLDGNSLQLLRGIMGGGSIRSASSELRRCLHQAYETAVATFPLSGRRPEHERDCLAALLRDALEVHTSAKVTATQSSIFENLLCFVFEILDEPHQNLHTLAERVLKRKLVSRPSAGVLMIDKIESGKK